MAIETIDPEAMHTAPFHVPPEHARVYTHALRTLNDARVPYVVSGAYAMYHFTGRVRNTKDLDIFLQKDDLPRALDALAREGFATTTVDDKWLAKAKQGEIFIDLIFAAGNLVATVDAAWIEKGIPSSVLGVPTRLSAPEDLLSFKAFICERHRFDGADIAHIIKGLEGKLDWSRLLARMGEHWQLLLWHLLFFRYVYPCHAHFVPDALMVNLLRRELALVRQPPGTEKGEGFRGTLVSAFSFHRDVAEGYRDLRNELREKPSPAEGGP